MQKDSRLRQARLESGYTVDEISKMLCITQQAYYNYESQNRDPSSDTLRKLSEILGVSTDYLLGLDSNLSHMTTPITAGAKIKVLGCVPAGIPVEAIECIIDEIEISKELNEDGHEYFGLLVSGDSMYPEYLDGDIIIIRRQESATTGDDVIAYINGYDATLKRFQQFAEGIRLKALNPAYESKFYTNDEIAELPISILGVVVEMRRVKK